MAGYLPGVADTWRVLLTLALGYVTGILSGMFGVGGGAISTPGIRILGATAIEGVGSTLPAIFPSALSGTLRYHREGMVVWPLVAGVGTAGSAAAVGASLLSHRVPGNGHLLMVATAALVGLTAWRMAAGTSRPVRVGRPPAERPEVHPGRVVVTALGAGGLSGLLGLGGGVILVPAFSEWLRLPIKQAVGTSLACVGLLAVPSTLTHLWLGDINWVYALPLCVAVVPGARVGARLALAATERGLRLSVAGLLGIVAVVFAVGELLALT